MKGVVFERDEFVVWCSEVENGEARRAYVFSLTEHGLVLKHFYVQESHMRAAQDVLEDAPEEFIKSTMRVIEDYVFNNRWVAGAWVEFSTMNPAPDPESVLFKKAKASVEKRRTAEGL